ncbi:MAG TPA: dTDP-glucose 4,6-dehydratase [Thermoleophilia bacterium]|nr:dTDP-glucose 4,6-dehydratase [Thermoleophilia bacterium]
MRIVVTGGAGFIGSHFIRLVLREHPDDEVVNLDKLTYAGNLDNLRDVEGNERYTFVKGDICDAEVVDAVTRGADALVNFAAETHVDRSITGADDFIRTDVLGTHVLLEAAREHELARYVQVSTDEVYGSIDDGAFTEDDPLRPSSPYSAGKAAADMLVTAAATTFGLPVLITRSSNNFGPNQYPEKLIPLFVTNALEDRPLPVYGDGLQMRDWIHVEDNCRAIDLVLRRGPAGEIYNVGAGNERSNLDLTRRVLRLLGKDDDLIRFVDDRPGHDRRYALDCEKLHALGWEPRLPFDDGLAATVDWYRENSWWWHPIKSGQWKEYYAAQYRGLDER